MQKLKTGKMEKIKQKLLCTTPTEIYIQNKMRRHILLDVEESLDGVKPKIIIRIKQLRRKIKRGN